MLLIQDLLYIPNDFVLYYETKDTDAIKYLFIPEDHENTDSITKTAEFIKNNYQEGDIVLVENFVAGSEVLQETCRSTKPISMRIKVMGWDIEEMCTDDNFKPNTVSHEARQLELKMIEKFQVAASVFNDSRKDITTILTDKIINEISNYTENTSSNRITESEVASIISQIEKLLEKEKIDFFSEDSIGFFLNNLSIMLDETEKKIKLFKSNEEEKIKKSDIALEIDKNISLIKVYLSALIEIEKRSNCSFRHMSSLINSYRIINTFQDRVLSMTQTLDKVASSAQRIFVIAGMNHFLEGENATRNSEMKLTKFYDWMKNKSCMVIGPKI